MREREALLKRCLWNVPHVQISQVERMGDFLCLYHRQPIVVEPWKSAATGKVGQVERVDYRYILPVELTFGQKL